MTQESKQQLKQKLQRLDSYQFEKLIADIWDAQGYDTSVRQASRDRGVDVEAVIKNPIKQRLFIQAKRHKEGNKIGSQKIRNYATLYQQDDTVDLVVVVTTSTFTEEAVRLAWDLDVKIIDWEGVMRKIVETDNSPFDINTKGNYSSKKGKSYTTSFDKSKINPLFQEDKQIDSTVYSFDCINQTYDVEIDRIEEKFNYDLFHITITPRVPIKKLVGVGKRSIDAKNDTTLLEVKVSNKDELVEKVEKILSKL